MSPEPRPAILHRARPLLVTALALAACQSSGERRDEREVPTLLKEGQYREALQLAEAAHRERPDDPVATDEYRLASAAVLLEQGRRMLFADRNEEALRRFLEAKRIAPEEPVIDDWVYNAREKLALLWHRNGMRAQAGGDLELAVDSFERSLDFQPGFERAESSLMRTLLQLNYRQGLGREYYDEGVRDLHEHLLDEAEFGFSAALKYSPQMDRAAERRHLARVQLAEERAALAAQLEAENAFAAARNEYRMALLLDLDCLPAQSGYARADREEDAAAHLREADRLLLRKDYQGARAELATGLELTEVQHAAFDAMESAVIEAQHGDLYKRTRTLESDEQYAAAIEVYEELIEEATYFQDAITRKETLESYIENAERLYEQAAAAASGEERAAYLRQIEVFWPDYRDVQEQLAELGVER
jgi:tetratricopeptide (TPR) repeat protein